MHPPAGMDAPTKRPKRGRVAGAVLFVALAAACGGGGGSGDRGSETNAAGDIPDNQVFVAYAPPAGGFSVKVPEGWARTEKVGAVTFTDRFNSVRIETVAAANAPTVQSVEGGEVGVIGAASVNFEAGRVSAITRAAGPAILVTYRADGPPDPVTAKVVPLDVERYEFWKDGREVVLTLSGPVGADNVDPWRTVSDSFAWA